MTLDVSILPIETSTFYFLTIMMKDNFILLLAVNKRVLSVSLKAIIRY